MNPLREARLVVHRDAEQLDAVAEFFGIGDVDRIDVANAFDEHRAEVDLRAEREAGDDGELVRRVDAVDVEARIGLGVAQRLRFGEHDVERPAGFAHVGQHVVAGAVQNPVDAREPVGRETLAQRLDDGDPAGDGGFEAEVGAVRLGALGERRAAVRDQRLVRRHHVHAAAERAPDEIQGGSAGAADQLDRHVDVALGQRRSVVDPGDAVERHAAILAAVAGGHGDDVERAAAARGEQRPVVAQQLQRACADRAEAGDADAQRRAHRAAAASGTSARARNALTLRAA